MPQHILRFLGPNYIINFSLWNVECKPFNLSFGVYVLCYLTYDICITDKMFETLTLTLTNISGRIFVNVFFVIYQVSFTHLREISAEQLHGVSVLIFRTALAQKYLTVIHRSVWRQLGKYPPLLPTLR